MCCKGDCGRPVAMPVPLPQTADVPFFCEVKTLMLLRTLFVWSACLMMSSAWAVNKCKGADGKTVFQDRPCAGPGESLVVRPSSGSAPPAPTRPDAPEAGAPGPSGGAPQGNNYQQQLARAQEERERRDKWFVMRNLGQALDRQLAQCEQEQQRMASQKAYSRNNLAGATRDVSISNEMQAAAALCSERIKMAQAQFESAKLTCERIKCIPATH